MARNGRCEFSALLFSPAGRLLFQVANLVVNLKEPAASIAATGRALKFMFGHVSLQE